jgi:hypothetical protein
MPRQRRSATAVQHVAMGQLQKYRPSKRTENSCRLYNTSCQRDVPMACEFKGSVKGPRRARNPKIYRLFVGRRAVST